MVETESAAVAAPIPTSLNVTALAKRFGVARTTIQRRLKRGWVPPATAPRKPRVPAARRSIHATPGAAPAATEPAAPDAASPAAPDAASPAASTVMMATFAAALALAACSAGMSVTGLSTIFAGASLPVIGMGTALEFGKLSAVAWLGQRNGGRALRCALLALVGVLMVLNSIGVYGFLSRAHITHAVAAETLVDAKAADVEARIGVQAGIVADLDHRIRQLDNMVRAATKRGYTKTAMALVNDQTARRVDLERRREEAAGQLAQLKVEQAGVAGERKVADADLGPVRYLATLLGTTDDETMRAFILAVALLLDPAAVLLLLAAAARGNVGT